MRRGTKIGWALVAFSILLSVWVIAGGSISNADEDTPDPAGESGIVEPIDGGGLFGSGLDGYSETTDADGNTTFNFGDGTTGYYNAADGSMTYYDADGSYYIQYADGTGKQFDADGNEIELLGGTPSLLADPAPSDITTVSVPSGTITIDNQAYAQYTSLTSITIPATVNSIAADAFDNCTNLTTVSIDAANGIYYSKNNLIYLKGDDTLVIVPKGLSEITLSDDTAMISSTALAQLKANNTKVWINDDPDLKQYLQTNGVSYEIIGGGGGTTPVDPTPVDPTPTPPSGGGGGAVAGGGVPVIPSNGTAPATNSDGTITATTTDGQAGASASAATGTTHDKDATPTTADGDIDPRYILVLAVFLAGIGMIIYGQQGKYKYMTENRRK